MKVKSKSEVAHWRRKWQPTPVLLPGESQGRGLPSTGSHRVGHDWSDLAAVAVAKGFPGGPCGKEPAHQWRRHKRCGFNSWFRKIPWRRVWQPTPAFSPGESHGQRSLVDYSPWGHRVGHDWSDIAQMHVDLNTHTHTIWEVWVSVLFRDLLRTITQEKASQMALRNYSQVVRGEIVCTWFWQRGYNATKHTSWQKVASN